MAVPQISVQEAQRLLVAAHPPRLIDVREADEWEICRIEGAELIPLSQWPAIVSEKLLNRDEPLIIQCHHGGRSERAAAFLLSNGFTNVQNLAGGIHAWSLVIDSKVARY